MGTPVAPLIDQATRYLRTFQNTERFAVIIPQVQIFVLQTVLCILYQTASPRLHLTDSLLVVVAKWLHCRSVEREAMKNAIILLLLVAFVGCSGNEEAKGLTMPLTLAQWQQMDETSKYELETLERLKESVPEYHDNQKWQQFLVEEVVPGVNQFDSKDKINSKNKR